MNSSALTFTVTSSRRLKRTEISRRVLALSKNLSGVSNVSVGETEDEAEAEAIAKKMNEAGRLKNDALHCITSQKTEMSPPVRRITIEGPDQCTSLLFAIVVTAVFIAYIDYHSPGFAYNLTGVRLFKPEVHDPAPCKLFSTEKPNQCPKWLATQFMRRAIDSQYRFVKEQDRCWHRNRDYMIRSFHKYYYTSEPFTAFTRYVATDMAIEMDADPMSLI